MKFNGEAHADLTPGEYTQLTGRAGRRGIDVEGHAVVIWQPGVDPEQVAGLASTRTYPLRQLVPARLQHGGQPGRPARRGGGRELLEQSFGQFQADRSVVGLARRIERNAEAMAGYAASMRCHLGDFAEYAALRRRIAEREKALRRQGTADRGARRRPSRCARCARATSSRCRAGAGPGWPSSSTRGAATATRGRWCSPRTAGPGRLVAGDFPTPVEPLARMRVPKQFDHRSPQDRRDLASSLRNTGRRAGRAAAAARRRRHGRRQELASCAGRCGAPLPRLRGPGGARPLGRAAGPAGAGHRAAAAEGGAARTRWPGPSTGSARCSTSGATWPAGRSPSRPEAGPALDRVRPAGRRVPAPRRLGRAGSGRAGGGGVRGGVRGAPGGDEPVPRVPRGPVSDALAATVRLWSELEADEGAPRASPDPGARPRASSGRSTGGPAASRCPAVSPRPSRTGMELSAGDFVRWCRQVVDLLDQIAGVAGRWTARWAGPRRRPAGPSGAAWWRSAPSDLRIGRDREVRHDDPAGEVLHRHSAVLGFRRPHDADGRRGEAVSKRASGTSAQRRSRVRAAPNGAPEPARRCIARGTGLVASTRPGPTGSPPGEWDPGRQA